MRRHGGRLPVARFPAALGRRSTCPAPPECEVLWGTCPGALLRFVTVWESPESGPWAHRRRRGGGPGALDVHRAALAPFYAAALDDGCKRFLLASTRPTILRSILKRYGSVPAVACRCLRSGRNRGNTGTLRPPAVDAGGRGEGNGSVG